MQFRIPNGDILVSGVERMVSSRKTDDPVAVFPPDAECENEFVMA